MPPEYYRILELLVLHNKVLYWRDACESSEVQLVVTIVGVVVGFLCGQLLDMLVIVFPAIEEHIVGLAIRYCKVSGPIVTGGDVGIEFARLVGFLGVSNIGQLFLVVLHHLCLSAVFSWIVHPELCTHKSGLHPTKVANMIFRYMHLTAWKHILRKALLLTGQDKPTILLEIELISRID